MIQISIIFRKILVFVKTKFFQDNAFLILLFLRTPQHNLKLGLTNSKNKQVKAAAEESIVDRISNKDKANREA